MNRESAKVILNETQVQLLKKDLSLLLKNTKRDLSPTEIDQWRSAVVLWRSKFDLILIQVREGLEGRIRETRNLPEWSRKINLEWAEEYLRRLDDAVIPALYDLPVNSLQSQMGIGRATYGRMFSPEELKRRAGEQLTLSFKEKVPKWASSVLRRAPRAWKYLEDLAAWTERGGMYGGGGGQDPLILTQPTIENVQVGSLRLQFVGFPESDDQTKTYLPSFLQGVKEFERGAREIFPWVIQNSLPIVVNWSGGDPHGGDSAAHYERDRIVLEFFGLASSPKRLVHVLAHEMGHHIWRSFFSDEMQNDWIDLINGDYGNLDLKEVLGRLKPEETLSELSGRIEREDPILHLQLESLFYDPSYRGFNLFGLSQIQPYLEEGNSSVVKVPANPITGYSSSNPEEAFCEAFGKAVSGQPVPEKISLMLKSLLPGIRLSASRVARLYLMRVLR